MNELFRFVSLRPAQPANPKRSVPSRTSNGVVKIVTGKTATVGFRIVK